VEPAEFDRYREAGMALGFKYVASGPLVRSSYRAAEAFLKGVLRSETTVPTQPAPYSDRYGKRRLEVVS
jgi:lipoic acid synthetase